jgi:hypothetical protein
VATRKQGFEHTTKSVQALPAPWHDRASHACQVRTIGGHGLDGGSHEQRKGDKHREGAACAPGALTGQPAAPFRAA